MALRSRSSICHTILLVLLLIIVVETSASIFYFPSFYQEYFALPECRPFDFALCPSTIPPPSLSSRLLGLLDYFAATGEVLLRGFCLGFGLRMLKYILLQNDESLDQMGNRIRISIVAGMTMAAFLYGLSMFVPTRLRMNWFDIPGDGAVGVGKVWMDPSSGNKYRY